MKPLYFSIEKREKRGRKRKKLIGTQPLRCRVHGPHHKKAYDKTLSNLS